MRHRKRRVVRLRLIRVPHNAKQFHCEQCEAFEYIPPLRPKWRLNLCANCIQKGDGHGPA